MWRSLALGAVIAVASWGDGQDELAFDVGVRLTAYKVLVPSEPFDTEYVHVPNYPIEPCINSAGEHVILVPAVKGFPSNSRRLFGTGS